MYTHLFINKINTFKVDNLAPISFGSLKEISRLKESVDTCAYCNAVLMSQEVVDKKTDELVEYEPAMFFEELNILKPSLPDLHSKVVDVILKTPLKEDQVHGQRKTNELTESMVQQSIKLSEIEHKIAVIEKVNTLTVKLNSVEKHIMQLNNSYEKVNDFSKNLFELNKKLKSPNIPKQEKIIVVLDYISENSQKPAINEFYEGIHSYNDDDIERFKFLQRAHDINKQKTNSLKRVLKRINCSEEFEEKLNDKTQKELQIQDQIDNQVKILTQEKGFLSEFIEYSGELLESTEKAKVIIKSDINAANNESFEIKREVDNIIFSNTFSLDEKSSLNSSSYYNLLNKLYSDKKTVEEELKKEFITDEEKALRSKLNNERSKQLGINAQIDQLKEKVQVLNYLNSLMADQREQNILVEKLTKENRKYIKPRKKMMLINSLVTSGVMKPESKINRIVELLNENKNFEYVQGFYQEKPEYKEKVCSIISLKSDIKRLKNSIKKLEQLVKGYEKYQKDKEKLPDLENQRDKLSAKYNILNKFIKTITKGSLNLSLEYKTIKMNEFIQKNPEFFVKELENEQDFEEFLKDIKAISSKEKHNLYKLRAKINKIKNSNYRSISKDKHHRNISELSIKKDALVKNQEKLNTSTASLKGQFLLDIHKYMKEKLALYKSKSSRIKGELKEAKIYKQYFDEQVEVNIFSDLFTEEEREQLKASKVNVVIYNANSQKAILRRKKASLNVEKLQATYNLIKKETALDILGKAIKEVKLNQERGKVLDEAESYISNYDQMEPKKLLHAILSTRLKTFDHIKQKSKDGEATPDNAFITCSHCNKERGDEEIDEFLQKGEKIKILLSYMNKYSKLRIARDKLYIESVLENIGPKVQVLLDDYKYRKQVV